MGIIRGTAITFFSFILLISLFLMNATLSVSWSLEHDTLQASLKNSAGNILNDSMNDNNLFSEEAKANMNYACLSKSEYVFEYGIYNFTIPCEVIEDGTGSIIDYGINHLVDTIYYAEYKCEFWECVKESSVPLVLFSEKAMDYWRNKFILLAVISLVLFALTFLISKKRNVTVMITGILIVLSSLPFRRLDWVLNLIPEIFPE